MKKVFYAKFELDIDDDDHVDCVDFEIELGDVIGRPEPGVIACDLLSGRCELVNMWDAEDSVLSDAPVVAGR